MVSFLDFLSLVLGRAMRFIHFCERQKGMSVAGARSHFRGDPDRFHQLSVGSALAKRRARVAVNAIRALRDVCGIDSYDVLGFGR